MLVQRITSEHCQQRASETPLLLSGATKTPEMTLLPRILTKTGLVHTPFRSLRDVSRKSLACPDLSICCPAVRGCTSINALTSCTYSHIKKTPPLCGPLCSCWLAIEQRSPGSLPPCIRNPACDITKSSPTDSTTLHRHGQIPRCSALGPCFVDDAELACSSLTLDWWVGAVDPYVRVRRVEWQYAAIRTKPRIIFSRGAARLVLRKAMFRVLFIRAQLVTV